MSESPYVISLKELTRTRADRSDKKKNLLLIDAGFSPLSGYEPKYNPKRWNEEKTKYNHNCFAYVLNALASKRSGKPQPGYYSGSYNDGNYNCASFYKRLKRDMPAMYITKFADQCAPGFYKGFIALATKEGDEDYHFYRQDSSGYWSHKPGRSEATDVDASGNKIKNPATANRHYEHFNYSVPCFFFCVHLKLKRSHSI